MVVGAKFDYRREPVCNKDFIDIAYDEMEALKRMLLARDYYDVAELLSNLETAKRALDHIKF